MAAWQQAASSKQHAAGNWQLAADGASNAVAPIHTYISTMHTTERNAGQIPLPWSVALIPYTSPLSSRSSIQLSHFACVQLTLAPPVAHLSTACTSSSPASSPVKSIISIILAFFGVMSVSSSSSFARQLASSTQHREKRGHLPSHRSPHHRNSPSGADASSCHFLPAPASHPAPGSAGARVAFGIRGGRDARP